MPLTRPLVVLAIALMLVAYWPVTRATLVYEDAVYVSGAAQTPAWTELVGPRGLTRLTFWLNPWLTGDPSRSAQSYHAINVLLHLLMGLSVYGLGRVIVGDPGLAALGASLFLVHPLASEAVAYVAGRAELLAGLGTVWAVWAASSGPLRLGRLLVSGASVLLAIGGKETGVMAIPLVVGVLIWQGRMRRARWRWWALGAVALLFLACLGWIAALRLVSNDYLRASERQLFGNMAMQSWALWHLLPLLIWPIGLTIDHDFDVTGRLWPIVTLALTLVTLLATTWWGRRAPTVGFLTGWIALTLLPRFLVPIPELLNEHQLYTALVAPCLVAPSWLADLDQWLQHRRTACPVSS